jgi:DNA (cytosine-5)-methyltransferase 1
MRSIRRRGAAGAFHSDNTASDVAAILSAVAGDRVVGLFAGIGGIELGLHEVGYSTELLCEIDEAAGRVLAERFPNVELVRDVRELDHLPAAEIVAAGFPCQDLSQAGRTAGIRGQNSGLVDEVFRLVDELDERSWLLLENVPFMLQLDRGKAMRHLTTRLFELGFSWAYRIVDTRAFGIPQRRQRVVLLASRARDPRTLFIADAGEPSWAESDEVAFGFYWTEGVRGLGWAVDAVPTLKGGSGVGIPSPPAILLPDGGGVVVPDVRDAERLQGFASDWTQAASNDTARGEGARWKLVGNAVSVPVARWVGERTRASETFGGDATRLRRDDKWPSAAFGTDGKTYAVEASRWPVQEPYQHLVEFLRYPTRPLSPRATAGFLSRTGRSSLRFPQGFIEAVQAHLESVEDAAVVAV